MKDKFWIAFSSIEALDSTFVQRLYNYFGDVEIAWNANFSDLSQIEQLSTKKASTFLRERDKTDVDKTFEEVNKRGIKYVTFEDKNYPYMLKNISNPPIVLYYKGDLFDCNLEKTLAVVGSRRASINAKAALKDILKPLNGTDICIVSGLAAGIDTAAHTAALDFNLKTIGVIASGFDFTYPTSNKKLYERIEDGHGAVVSEYYPTFEPLKFRFPQRNRIVSGLSYGTLVAEAALKSGALITANLTLEQGRELMCIPGLISNPNTEGIYKLLKQGAAMVTKSEDLLNALNWQIETIKPEIKKDNLTENEEKIITSIEIEEKGFDQIQSETTISTDDLLMLLTTMELKGIIEQVPGDRYKKV